MTRESRFGYWIAALFAVLIAVGIAVMAYQSGVSHGLALQIPAGSAERFVPPYYWYRPWGFGFFGPFFFLIFWIVLFRAFWWGGGRWRRHYYWADGPGSFDDWHRRAHERMNNPNNPPPSSSPMNA